MHHKRTKRGFSLIEVLFGIFLISACATILAATVPVATSSRVSADWANRATSIAHTQLEQIRQLGYARLRADDLKAAELISSVTPVDTNTYSFNAAEGLPSGSGTVKITQVDIDLRRVEVVVRYEVRGVPKTRSVGGLVANL